MQVVQIYMKNSLRNFNYIIYSEKSKEAIYVDPLNLELTLPVAKSLNLEPKYLINTHYHPDHMHGNSDFLEIDGAEEVIFKDGDILELAPGDYIQALFTPGHVMDHLCFLVISDNKLVGIITGDALFNAGVGNCKLGGDVEAHYHSTTDILAKLPEDLIIYPSHDYLLTNLKFAQTVEPGNIKTQELIKIREGQDLDNEFIFTDIKKEKEINPFMRLDSLELKERFTGQSAKDIFIGLRKLRDNY